MPVFLLLPVRFISRPPHLSTTSGMVNVHCGSRDRPGSGRTGRTLPPDSHCGGRISSLTSSGTLMRVPSRAFSAFSRSCSKSPYFPQHVLLPGGSSLLHGVQPLFHIGGEFRDTRDVGEPLFHPGGHHTAQVGEEMRRYLPSFATYSRSRMVVTVGGLSGGAADALLLHGPDQRGVCMGRGSG